MNITEVTVSQSDMNKLLSSGNGDAAILYLYLKSGNDSAGAGEALHMSNTRVECAGALLRQLGLWQDARRIVLPGERPGYSEQDVLAAMDHDRDFQVLYGEIQRLLGRNLNTEEMKIILSFVRYLGMSPDVVCVLVCYCKERARQRGSLRNPSLRTIEKEAYAWAERGIDTMEEAAAFIRAQNQRNTLMSQLKRILQIRDRQLTPGEEKYAQQWLEWGFEQDAIALAYERTCLNTGGLSWAYMNKILTRWQAAGLMSVDKIRSGDKKQQAPTGATGLGASELEELQRMMQGG